METHVDTSKHRAKWAFDQTPWVFFRKLRFPRRCHSLPAIIRVTRVMWQQQLSVDWGWGCVGLNLNSFNRLSTVYLLATGVDLFIKPANLYMTCWGLWGGVFVQYTYLSKWHVCLISVLAPAFSPDLADEVHSDASETASEISEISRVSTGSLLSTQSERPHRKLR